MLHNEDEEASSKVTILHFNIPTAVTKRRLRGCQMIWNIHTGYEEYLSV